MQHKGTNHGAFGGVGGSGLGSIRTFVSKLVAFTLINWSPRRMKRALPSISITGATGGIMPIRGGPIGGWPEPGCIWA